MREPVVCQKKSVRLEQARDVLKRQRLLEPVVIEEHICGDDQIEWFCGRFSELFENNIQIHRFARQNDVRTDRKRTGLKPTESWRGCNRSGGRADLAAECTPVINCFGSPWPRFARQLHDVVLSFFGAVSCAAQMLENLLTNVERDNFNLSRFGESQSNKGIVNRERLQRLERIKIVTESFVGEIQSRPDYRYAITRFLS